MESVFAKSTLNSNPTATPLSVATKDGSTNFDRITGPSSLTIALESAGFEPERSQESVSIRVENAGWKLPAEMTVDVENDRILCRMSLVKIDSTTINLGETLLALMTTSHRIANASFVVDADANMIQLQATIANRNVTSKRLNRELASMAETAIANSETWLKLKGKSTTAASSASDTLPTAASSPTTASIAGQWSASLPSNVSIAIEFKRDGTFKMAHVADSRSAVSSGTVLRDSNQLTLAEAGKDDVKFQIESITASVMNLRLINSTGKASTLIKFSKAGL